MRVCLVASSEFPIRQPFAGGLEAWTHMFCTELGRRGHDVVLFAAPGSDPALPVHVLPVDEPGHPDAYRGLVRHLHRSSYDVVHNSSLHPLPVLMARTLPTPVVTTLHTPPEPWLVDAVRHAHGAGTFVAVSRATAEAWARTVAARVIGNGVDVDAFTPGPGDGPAVWTGRLTPEKAPHEAIEAARRAGVDLVLAGPVTDEEYVDAAVRPLLGAGVEYAGHLDHTELAERLGRATVSLVTPNWDEPFGLVAAEALACGTPVAAYARGALSDLVTPEAGCLAPPGDVERLADAIPEAASRDRSAVRRHAEQHCSLRRMADDYEAVYRQLTGAGVG